MTAFRAISLQRENHVILTVILRYATNISSILRFRDGSVVSAQSIAEAEESATEVSYQFSKLEVKISVA